MITRPMTFQELFANGLKRTLPLLVLPPGGPHLDLGPGYSPVPDAYPLEYPEWNATRDTIPWGDEKVACIHAYHFFEHLADPRPVLRECQRVLKVGGVLNIVVPYYTSQMAAHDLDHKSRYCEETWRNLFANPGYAKDHTGWRFEIGLNVIAGAVERNLALFTQLIRI